MADNPLTGETLGGGSLTITVPGVPGKKIYPLSIIASIDNTDCDVELKDAISRKWKVNFPNGGYIDEDYTDSEYKRNKFAAEQGEDLVLEISASTAKAFASVSYEVL